MENGKIAIARDLKNGIGFGSTEFHVIRLLDKQSRQFFFFYFLQQKFRQEAKRAMTSGTKRLLRVPTNYMRKDSASRYLHFSNNTAIVAQDRRALHQT